MRVAIAVLCLVAVFLSWLIHEDIGRHIIADYRLARVVVPWPWLTAACTGFVCVASAVVGQRPDRVWAWPVMLIAWLLWIAAGRIVGIDLRSGAVDGHWYVFPTDHHSLRPAEVPGAQYTCEARVETRGWWLDLEYAGSRASVWLGPFIHSEAAAEVRGVFAPCR